MAKFDRAVRQAGVSAQLSSPVKTAGQAWTHEGGAGHTRDVLGELFTLAVTNLVGEHTFYEPGGARDERFVHLVHAATRTDPGWVARFAPWLRTTCNLRSASLVMAVEYIRAGGPDGDRVLDAVCQRADEPAEALAYYQATNNGRRAIANRVRKGVAAAAVRLYTERSALKYDGDGRAWRMGDVLDLTHPVPRDERQAALFRWLLDRRHDWADSDRPDLARPDGTRFAAHLPLVAANRRLLALPVDQRRTLIGQPDAAERLRAAGMTWESLAGWLQGSMDAAAWCSVIPSMGYMAQLRNLRNFDQAGVPDEVAERVAAKLADPDEVAASRQLPFRFFSAYREVPSDRWGHALERALRASLGNVPILHGRTLVLVDTSSSMGGGISGRSKVTSCEVGALLALAFAHRNEVDLHGYAGDGRGRVTFAHPITAGESVLRAMDRFTARIGEVGHGTMTVEAIQETYRRGRHARVLVVTDGQAFPSHRGTVDSVVPADVPLFTFTTVGYRTTHAPSGRGNRHELGGFSDATFTLLAALEARRSAGWPF
jgi:hypothetical protein